MKMTCCSGRTRSLVALALATALVAVAPPAARAAKQPAGGGAAQAKLVHLGPDGRLVYAPDARGNTIPDYSYAGYGGGGVALPVAPVKVRLQPQGNGRDDTSPIQSAIDQVSKMPADNHGIRGA